MTTAFHERTATGEESGALAGEFSALVSAAGVCQLSGQAGLAITGGDRVRWLNGMVSNNIRDLAAGHGVYAFLLNPQGHILSDLYAYNRGESFLLAVDRAQVAKIWDHFDHYIIMDDVEVANLSDKLTVLGIAGPKAAEVLSKAGFSIPELAPLQLIEITGQEVAVTLVRGDNPAVPWYELWLAPEATGKVREALIRAGAKAAGGEALELLRIASGMPRYGQDIRERDLPQETEQHRALNFSKGCYIGQEIVERIRSRGNVHRKFTGFVMDGALPQPGTKIQAEGKDVGEITSSASLPLASGERKIALGYIRREIGTPGKQLQAVEAKATVADVPFAGVFG
jgi:folate-binding protein YgfZ